MDELKEEKEKSVAEKLIENTKSATVANKASESAKFADAEKPNTGSVVQNGISADIGETNAYADGMNAGTEKQKADRPSADDENRIFRKYKIKDIVFLAIMAAVMLVTGAIMPLVAQIPLFGIVQIALGLQFSVFPAIGMMKVRKPGALLFMSLCCGVVTAFMNIVMFVSTVICAFITEALVLLIFRGYKKDVACLFAGAVYFPLTLPFLYIWYQYIYTWTGSEGQAVNAFVGSAPAVAAGMSIAIIALCFAGALIGVVISRELKKSGVMKK
jgi:energy-coupling factor transport system substrate-specific component